ncbi:MAG TPA: Cys-Gln thioester bond-forming surface protein [Miltoncostaeaceae bacterium]|nr:Cys-Gln thioester bond-forming surface protein [Miltoncostaeaceae bacterium]
MVALLATLIAAVGTAAAVPATQTWTGAAGGPTPDSDVTGLTLYRANGSVVTTEGIAGTLNFTLNGAAYVGYCSDIERLLSEQTEPVDLLTLDPPSTADQRAVAWILLNRTPAGPPTPESERAGAAAQIAVWILIDPQIRASAPTNDAALNAAAAALVAEARAATATPATLALSAPTPAAGATTSTVTITGRPGAVVTLAVASGTGTLSTNQVTLSGAGTATVTATAAGAGVISLRATTAGDGQFLQINPTDPVKRPQPTVAANGSQIAATAQIAFSPAQVPAAPGTAAQTTPRISVSKTAPARAFVLKPVQYRIVVRNVGRVATRNTVLRDRIPSGLSFVRASRARSLQSGTLTFQLGRIAPGQSKVIYVWLRADADVRGSRVNVATASATGARTVRARATTLFRIIPRRVQPAVTG